MKLLKRISKFFTSLIPKATTLVSADYDEAHDIMTVTWSNGDVEQYYGWCTVWRAMPYMKRCSTATEKWLSDIYAYVKKHGQYPMKNKIARRA